MVDTKWRMADGSFIYPHDEVDGDAGVWIVAKYRDGLFLGYAQMREEDIRHCTKVA